MFCLSWKSAWEGDLITVNWSFFSLQFVPWLVAKLFIKSIGSFLYPPQNDSMGNLDKAKELLLGFATDYGVEYGCSYEYSNRCNEMNLECV